MDSEWFDRATDHWNGGCDHQNNTESNVDLTLKLGLPDDHDDQPQFEQYFRSNRALKTHQPAILSFNAPCSQGTNHQDMANAGLNHHWRLNGDNLHGSWPQEMMGNHLHYMNTQYAADSAVGFAAHPKSYSSINSNPGNFQMPTMKGRTILNTVARDGDHGENGSSTGSRRRGPSRQCKGTFSDHDKRCSNQSCNTDVTPMWRKGPLGPKTLCNACGIKYRKEEEKRRAREAAKRAHGN
ncbi:PREDICTED: GATA transcription factor 29-like [Populus euphratica]|uniref:GATA transcription factor 29-like n=1 Tax=Populus euphratica TaxID=75702 RepID=A0AAJ6XNA2_POPEU|nr:PREDICTED: GATA transcription factor 29-like [Populus euphratica]